MQTAILCLHGSPSFKTPLIKQHSSALFTEYFSPEHCRNCILRQQLPFVLH